MFATATEGVNAKSAYRIPEVCAQQYTVMPRAARAESTLPARSQRLLSLPWLLREVPLPTYAEAKCRHELCLCSSQLQSDAEESLEACLRLLPCSLHLAYASHTISLQPVLLLILWMLSDSA